jgi:hypothetical protein
MNVGNHYTVLVFEIKGTIGLGMKIVIPNRILMLGGYHKTR